MAKGLLLVALGLAVALAGCSSAEREWLKTDQPYTAEEFRRDMSACSPKGKVDEACMKSRGWVTVNPPKPDKTPQPTPSRATQPRY
jgi:hypothetical protein